MTDAVDEELSIPANDQDAAHLAKLAAIAAEGGLKSAREAIGLGYAIGRNTGRLEGSARTAAAWQASIDRAFDLHQPSDATAPPGTKVREE